MENILKDINHPDLFKIIDIRKDHDYIIIIAEYFNAISLRDFLKVTGKPFSEEEVQYIMKKIINIIRYLHNKRIVHRDITADNFLLCNESEGEQIKNNILETKIKLFNFYLAVNLPKGQFLFNHRGNIKYMAPEILRTGKYNEACDIWSLGVLCSLLITNDYPYNFKTLHKEGNANIYLPETLSKEAISFINCMLQYEQSLRKNIEELTKHEFLNKNPSNFNKIKIEDIKEHIENSKIKINIKDNEWVAKYFGWGIPT